MRICPAHESGGVGFGFGAGAGVADGFGVDVGEVEGVATGLGVGTAATVKTTGTWAGASVLVGSVKLMVPT